MSNDPFSPSEAMPVMKYLKNYQTDLMVNALDQNQLIMDTGNRARELHRKAGLPVVPGGYGDFLFPLTTLENAVSSLEVRRKPA